MVRCDERDQLELVRAMRKGGEEPGWGWFPTAEVLDEISRFEVRQLHFARTRSGVLIPEGPAEWAPGLSPPREWRPLKPGTLGKVARVRSLKLLHPRYFLS